MRDAALRYYDKGWLPLPLAPYSKRPIIDRWRHFQFVAAQGGVTAIAAGGYCGMGGCEAHTVALKHDGTVVAWGDNGNGQVTGTPTTNAPWSAIASPVRLEGHVLSGVTAIAAGYSHTVALVIPIAPNITTQPVDQTVSVWQRASFTVLATGYPFYYQWRKDGVDLAGATNATYTLAFAQTNQAGNYTVVVSNSAGSVTSAPPAVLTVDPPGAVVAVTEAWVHLFTNFVRQRDR